MTTLDELVAGTQIVPPLEGELDDWADGIEPIFSPDIPSEDELAQREAERQQQLRIQNLQSNIQTVESQYADLNSPEGSGDLFRNEYIIDRIPWVRDLYKAHDVGTAAAALKRIEDGNPEEMDYAVAARYIVKQKRAAELASEQGTGSKVFDTLTQLPSYALELASTAGAFTAGKSAGVKLAERLAGKVAEGTAKGLARTTLEAIPGAIAQTVANPQAIARATAEVQAKQNLEALFARDGAPQDSQGFLESLPAGAVDAFAEIASEHAGGAVGAVLSKVPGAARVSAMKRAVMEKWLRIHPGNSVDQFFQRLADVGGYNGMLGEMFEERVGAAISATGGSGEWRDVIPDAEQLKVEAISFMVPGIVNITAQSLASNSGARREFLENYPEQAKALMESEPTRRAFMEAGILQDSADKQERIDIIEGLKQEQEAQATELDALITQSEAVAEPKTEPMVPKIDPSKGPVEDSVPLTELGQKLEAASNQPDFSLEARRLKGAGFNLEAAYQQLPEGSIAPEDWAAVWNATKQETKTEPMVPKTDQAETTVPAAKPVTIKQDKGGWAVTGLPTEIADGLAIDFKGRRTKDGYVFKLDPRAGIAAAAGEIKAEAERDAAERAAGRVPTSLGYMEAGEAQAFEQERAERLKFEVQRIKDRNASIDTLLGPFKQYRGELKLNLLRDPNVTDYTKIKGFDQLVEASIARPELGLPTDPNDLFEMLRDESFTQEIDEDALLDKIDDELASKYEDALAELDDSFDFGTKPVEKKDPAPQIGNIRLEDVQKAFPGSQISASQDGKEGWDVTLPDGRQGKIRLGDGFKFTEEGLNKLEESYGRKFSPEQREQMKHRARVFGTTRIEMPNGESLQPSFLIRLDRDLATGKTLSHEAMHVAYQMALPAELKQQLIGRYANPKDPASKQEEDVIRAINGDKKLQAQTRSALREFLQKILDAIGLGGMTAEEARALLETEQFWKRGAETSSEAGSVEDALPKHPEQVAEEKIAMPGGDDLTSIKKAVVNEQRAKVNLPEIEGSAPETVEEWAESARVALANDPKAAIQLVNQLAADPRPITQHEAMLLQYRYRQLANELQPAVDAFFEASKSGNPTQIVEAKRALERARIPMTAFEEIIHASKETWGRAGVALQQLLRKDFSLETVLRRGREANEGQELNDKQVLELTEIAKQLEAKAAELDERQKKLDEQEAELASKKQYDEVVHEVRKRNVQKKSEKRQQAEKKVELAWAEFKRAASGRFGSGVPLDLLAPAVKVAKAYVELGFVRFGEFLAVAKQNMPDVDEQVLREAWNQAAPKVDMDLSDRAELTREARRIQRSLVEAGLNDREQVIDAVHESLKESLPDLTRRQTMDALSRYGQYQAQSQNEIEKLIRGMNSEILKLSQIDQLELAMQRVEELRKQGKTDDEIGKVLADENLLVEATGLVRDKPSDTIRQLTQKYNELKKSIPATPEGRAGLLQTSLSSIERGLVNRIADLNWEIENNQRIVKEKRDRPTSERIQALEAERDALKKVHAEMFPRRKLSDAQRLSNAVKAADRAIEALEKQIKNRDFDRAKPDSPTSKELLSKRARLKQLRAARAAAKAFELSQFEGEGGTVPKGKIPLTKEEIARRVYEANLTKRIADYQQMLTEGDFSPRPKKEARKLSQSELTLMREMQDLREQALKKFEDYRLSHLTGIAWGADKVAQVSHLARAIMTSGDISAVARQGGLVAMGRPEIAARALIGTASSLAETFNSENATAFLKEPTLKNAVKFLKSIDSRQAEFNVMHRLTSGKDGEFRQQAKLEMPESDQKITKQEEAFQGRWAKYIPGVSLSARLYTMILNQMRADLFDLMVQNVGRGGEVTLNEAKLIAEFVNIATGRTSVKFIKNHSGTLNLAFFAASYVSSRFQYLAMPLYLPFQGGVKSNWRVKREIGKEYARSVAGIGTVLGAFALLAALGYDDDDEDKPTIETDPRSSDFLKVKMGETRIDFLAGLQQAMVYSSRMALGGRKSTVSGEVQDYGEGHNPKTRLTETLNFARTKAAPVPGTIATIANNMTNVVGQKETPASLAASLVTPLSLRDIPKLLETQGVPKGAALSLLSATGVGVNTYGPKTDFLTGTPEQREKQIKDDLKAMKWNSPERPPYSEYLTDEQLKQFSDRLREKRGTVVHEATANPIRKTHKSDESFQESLKTLEKNREYLKAMGVDYDTARELLIENARRNGNRTDTDAFSARLGRLNKLFP